MDIISQIENLEAKLDLFVYNYLVVFLFLTLILFIITMRVVAKGKSSKKTKQIVYTLLGTSSLIILLSILYIAQDSDSIQAEVEELEKEFLHAFNKTVTVETKDIINSISVHKYYCPHVELKDTEKCTYVEFVSPTGITQVFIPLEGTAYANYDNSLSITYLDFSKKEREFVNEIQQVKHIVINKAHYIQEDGWSLGIRLDEE